MTSLDNGRLPLQVRKASCFGLRVWRCYSFWFKCSVPSPTFLLMFAPHKGAAASRGAFDKGKPFKGPKWMGDKDDPSGRGGHGKRDKSGRKGGRVQGGWS